MAVIATQAVWLPKSDFFMLDIQMLKHPHGTLVDSKGASQSG
jgi:hypothetical protein